MPAIRSTQYLAVTGTSGGFTNAMEPGFEYMFVANEDCWVKVTVTGGAAAADTADNILYIKGQQLFLKNPDHRGTTNSFVKVISDGTNCDAVLSLIEA
jgi:hypothetical protein